MMDEKRSSLFGLGNHQNPNFSQLSPYLNVDPSYLGNQTPEFVVNPDLERTKLEGSFSVIGGALFVGGAAGGAYGLFEGIRNTALAENMSSKVRRTQILNHTLKSGKFYLETILKVLQKWLKRNHISSSRNSCLHELT